MRLNVGCGEHYAEGWTNVEVSDHHRSDLIARTPLPIPDASVEAVYLGHVLEHVPWPDVDPFLTDIRRVLQPGGMVCAVGPDVYRTIGAYRAGIEPWDLVVAVLEHADEDTPEWPGCQHHWCCHETRLVGALRTAGFTNVEAVAVTVEALAGWPTVAHSSWQCAARGVAP